MEYLTAKDLEKEGYSKSGAYAALGKAKKQIGIKKHGKIKRKQFECFQQYGCVVSCGKECKN